MRVGAVAPRASPQLVSSGRHLVIGKLIDEVVEVTAVNTHGSSVGEGADSVSELDIVPSLNALRTLFGLARGQPNVVRLMFLMVV